LINLGEDPKFIFNYGSPAAENAKKISLTKKIDSNLINKFENNLIVVTFHPQTNNIFREDLKILKNIFKLVKLNRMYNFIFTNSNSDPGGLELLNKINYFCKRNINCFNAKSLGHENYLKLIKNSKLIIGNSSSGIIEGSTLKIPFLNIGDRQKGRLKSNNVLDSKSDFKSIRRNFYKIMKLNKKNIKNIFYKKNTSEKIVKIILKNLKNKKINNPKIFYEKK
jgi:UDP-hydrolysing UDP-N-acetyl-D-glucosamine 2-epimerase